MLGKLNTTCTWQKLLETNAYNEPSYAEPSILSCAIYKDTRLKQTNVGLVKLEEKYYILHTDAVSDGDLINGEEVAVEEVRSLCSTVLYYKAVVLNG